MGFLRRRQPGRRVYIFGVRIHHGAVGALAVLAGIWAMASDRHDFPWLRG